MAMKLLQIDSSARRASVTRALTGKFAEAWKKENPEGEVLVRDLAATPLPLITDEWVQASNADPGKLTAGQRQAIAVSNSLIAELEAADTIVIGAPMYNFTIPSPLKAWIDQVARRGRTFEYGPNGPSGLLNGKKVVVITSRGGAYAAGSPRAQADFQEPYLRFVLGFIGLKDVTFIHAENQGNRDLSAAPRTAAIERIQQVAAPFNVNLSGIVGANGRAGQMQNSR